MRAKRMTVKEKFCELAEEVLKDSDAPLPMISIIEKVGNLADTKVTNQGNKVSSRYLRDVTTRAATSLFTKDKRFTKHAQKEWKVNLWILADE